MTYMYLESWHYSCDCVLLYLIAGVETASRQDVEDNFGHVYPRRKTGQYTGLGLKVVPRLHECCGLGQAEVVSKSSNKIHQTWRLPFSEALYVARTISPLYELDTQV